LSNEHVYGRFSLGTFPEYARDDVEGFASSDPEECLACLAAWGCGETLVPAYNLFLVGRLVREWSVPYGVASLFVGCNRLVDIGC
jgi:hypothetical protein